jgi:hypothetical protein
MKHVRKLSLGRTRCSSVSLEKPSGTLKMYCDPGLNVNTTWSGRSQLSSRTVFQAQPLPAGPSPPSRSVSPMGIAHHLEP